MNAKRLLVVTVTFMAGLYYLLEFLLPPAIGGAIDSGGASAAAADTQSGHGVLYTASRDGDPPVIVEKAGSRSQIVVSRSIFRRDDYRGAQNPQVVGDRLYYIGLGWDDKTPRVCMAARRDGRWVPAAHAIVDKGLPGEWDSSGITWACVVPNPTTGPAWKMWYVGRQGNVGRVGLATSGDGMNWTKRKLVVRPPNGGSIESISVPPDPGAEFDVATLVVAGTSGPRRALYTVTFNDLGDALVGELAPITQGMPPRPVPVPAGMVLRDARHLGIGGSGPLPSLAVTLEDREGRASVHAVATGPEFVRIEPEPLIAPGHRPHTTYLSDARSTIDDLMVVIGAFAVGLGLISLMQVHGKKIVKRHPQWPESATFLAAAVAMAVATLWDRTHTGDNNPGKQLYNLLFYGLFQPLGSSMFSLLAAYLVSAAFRAFRIRSLDGALMAGSAVLIMLGQVPIGNWLTHGLPHAIQIPTIMTWILFVTNNAVVRAVNFGIFVGALATAVRVWLSMDHAAMRFD